MKLAAYSQNRDNNFNLIRVVASVLVILTHSYALTGDTRIDPLYPWTGYAWGGIAVDTFFFTSGVLITSSLLGRGGLGIFTWARILRIWPGLFFAILFSIAIGAAFTTLPLQEFLRHEGTREFLFDNLSLRKIEFELPGVFVGQPNGSVNGSLWTLVWEVRLYIAIGLIGLVTRRNPRWMLVICALITAVATTLYLVNYLHLLAEPIKPNRVRFFSLFFAGACVYLLREKIELRWSWFIAAFTPLVILSLLKQHQAFHVLYWLTLPYLILCLAYLPRGLLLQYNRLGDYSYGMYIYAFPIQQALYATVPGISVSQMFCLAFIGTLPFAILSWHLVEERALRFKNIDRLKTLLRRRDNTAQ